MVDTGRFDFFYSIICPVMSPLLGILVVDYYVINSQSMDAVELYYPHGRYWFHRGFNIWGFVSFFIGSAACIPFMLAQLGVISNDIMSQIGDYNWWIGSFIGGLVYGSLMPLFYGERQDDDAMELITRVDRKSTFLGGNDLGL